MKRTLALLFSMLLAPDMPASEPTARERAALVKARIMLTEQPDAARALAAGRTAPGEKDYLLVLALRVHLLEEASNDWIRLAEKYRELAKALREATAASEARIAAYAEERRVVEEEIARITRKIEEYNNTIP